MNHLKDDFLIDLAKACIISPEILSVVRPHLSYSYIKGEPYKHIFKYLFDYNAATNKSPTLGLVSQNVTQKETLELIGKIRDANVHDKKDDIISSFEDYIRRAKFIHAHKKAAETFQKGDIDAAYKEAYADYEELHNFSLKRKMYSRIYGDFDKRQKERAERDYNLRKVPTGIPAFDYHTRGGVDRGTGLLAIARSGVGKTTCLRSLGASASFRGINVLHLAAGDSTQKEVEDGYDSWWSGVDMYNIREGNFDNADLKKIKKAHEAYLSQCGEIFVHVFKQFHSASLLDCRNVLIDLLKEHDIGLVLFDLLESFTPGDGKKYGTNQEGTSAMKKANSEKIINIATEFDVAVAAVTQASDVSKEFWNNPNFVITRNNISNLKATIDPFAYCFTLNQTDDENDNDIMRIHEEKLRHYAIKSYESTYSIVQKRELGRFIDLAETKRRFWDDENKRVIRNAIKS